MNWYLLLPGLRVLASEGVGAHNAAKRSGVSLTKDFKRGYESIMEHDALPRDLYWSEKE